MLPRKNPMCHVCMHSMTLKRLKTIVMDTQTELRFDWRMSPLIHLDDHVTPRDSNGNTDCWFVLGEGGKATVIPSYVASDKTWERAFFVNPLEVDWMQFDLHDPTDMDYLISSVEILNDMKDLWINDTDTRNHHVMVGFTRFTGALKRLLIFASNSSISA